jgi:hypothetical protein
MDSQVLAVDSDFPALSAVVATACLHLAGGELGMSVVPYGQNIY